MRNRTEMDVNEREMFLDSCSHRRKLARALFHIRQIDAMLRLWARDGYRVFDQPNQKGGFELVGKMLKPLPDQIPLVIGDALQNLRNSLDNLAFSLAKTHSPGMTAEQEESVSFPIAGTKNIAPTDSRLAWMSSAAQGDICSLTPDVGRKNLDQDPLWLLNKTNNRDKHREVSVVAVVAAIRDPRFGSGHIDYLNMIGPQRLKLDVVSQPMMEWGPNTQIQAQLSHSLEVAFDKGVEVKDREVVATLLWFHQHIRYSIFPRLEKYL